MVEKINPDGSKTIYFGGIYEVRKNAANVVTGTTTYYPAGGAMRIEMYLPFFPYYVNGLYYVLSDQLGSASVVTDSSGVVVGTQGYYPYGETRYTSGSLFTDRLYTGQQENSYIKLMNYRSRWYDPAIGRFVSADSIIPNSSPQSLNRYSYVNNDPVNYNDPTGHCLGTGNVWIPDGTGGCNGSYYSPSYTSSAPPSRPNACSDAAPETGSP